MKKEKLKVLSPIRWRYWILLKEYTLEKTREAGHSVSQTSILENMITDASENSLAKTNKGGKN